MAKNFKFFRYLCYGVLIFGAISMLLPFLFMVTLSLSGEEQIFAYPPKFLPENVSFENYKNIVSAFPIKQYFLNSLIIAVITTIGQVLVSACAGYAFARLNFRFKEPLFIIILITMMIPPQVNIIPLFFVMRELNWTDTYQAMILPGMFGGFGVFMMRQYFKMLPKELEDAAKIDGCNTFEIFYKTALPLAAPAVATLGIFTFITIWNSFMWPLIVTTSDYMRTLPVGLAYVKAGYREVIMWGELTAYCVICCIPVLLLFLIGRKYIINDIMNGSVKE
ncbi:MAG: carbohydrate ABC transporter permease [Candidatus Gastranaerophilales bacterium]|nr:carbohydrate ABC transporter permease [Candidatus Gastranaerophilales bacterium]